MKLTSKTQICKVCGGCSKRFILVSYLSRGQDLDLRNHWDPQIYEYASCPDCGYCNSEIEEASEAIINYINSRAYQDLCRDRRYPLTANAFIRCAKVKEVDDHPRAASYAWQCAAWECDDAGLDKHARVCRRHSIEQMLKAGEQDPNLDPINRYAILIDLYRRNGEFVLAEQVIDLTSGLPLNSEQRAVLDFQKLLVRDGNSRAYSTDIVLDVIRWQDFLSRRQQGTLNNIKTVRKSDEPDRNKLEAIPVNTINTIFHKAKVLTKTFRPL